jgi:hypothetical protein
LTKNNADVVGVLFALLERVVSHYGYLAGSGRKYARQHFDGR